MLSAALFMLTFTATRYGRPEDDAVRDKEF
jgi:hypothetical protein